jgi:hypothetical protein
VVKQTIFLVIFFWVLFPCSSEELIEKRNKFILEGFGFTYELNKNMNLFILTHGQPNNIICISSMLAMNYRALGLHPYTWELDYDKFVAIFHGGYDYNKGRMTTYDENSLSRIISKDNVEYLFGIKNGMNIDDLENIIGEITKKDIRVDIPGGYTIQFFGNNSNGVFIDIVFKKIKTIAWYF